ncbi:recombinase [Xenorhabdus sp. KJ12.1]|uniref:recombinase RecA n=1 Tax=Xenorhabdus sp. KJ12.1 TaxID=1851571 RepID=UPI000C03BC06|nr:recombinase [Xenorhabdus sp. KJ12.1]PHM69544.1 recombinase A [Xenorhabdus sp. KJ12.1]
MATNDALKKFFKSTVKSNAKQQHVKVWLNTGLPHLNKAVSGKYSGGLPCGRIIEIFGWESSGKTYIATQVMKSAQQAGGVAIFMDHEKSFDSLLGEKCGLNVGDDGDWIYQQPETFEESIEYSASIVKAMRDSKVIKPEAPIVLVFDSLASMVPNQIFQKFENKASGKGKDKDNLNMNDNTALARCTSSHFPALAQWANKYNVCMIFLNQCRLDLGVTFGDNTKAPGGKAPAFYASVRIQLSKAQIKEGAERIGDVVTAKVIKNKVAPPFKTASWSFYYDTDIGIDSTESLVEHMLNIGYLQKNASGRILLGDKAYSRKEVIENFKKLPTEKIIELLEKWHTENAEIADAAMDGSEPEDHEEE